MKKLAAKKLDLAFYFSYKGQKRSEQCFTHRGSCSENFSAKGQ